MEKFDYSEIELRNAVIKYAEAWNSAVPIFDQNHVYSDEFFENKKKIINLGEKRDKQKKQKLVFKYIVAVIVLLLLISCATLTIPSVYAVLRNWTVEIYNKYVYFNIMHTSDEHAMIIACPGNIPDGYEVSDNYHNGYYTRTMYKESSGEGYIQFEYSKPTESQKRKIERRARKSEEVILDVGVKASYVSVGKKHNLFWYDEDRDLYFNVLSNMDKESLLYCFPTVNYRMPYYEPEWLPEGYEKLSTLELYPENIMEYYNKNDETYIYVIYDDLAEYEGTTAFFAGDNTLYELIEKDSSSYHFSTSENEVSYSEILWIDEENNIVFNVQAVLSKENLIKLAESIRCVEPTWQK